MIEPAPQNAANAPTAVAAAAYLSALYALPGNIQPLLLGALADSYGFGNEELGLVSAVLIGVGTLCAASAPLWIRRVNWRTFAALGCIGAVAMLVANATVSSLPIILVFLALLGFFKGLIGAPSFASLGDTGNPDRNFGLGLMAQQSLAAGAAILLSAWLIPRFGAPGVFIALAMIFATGLFTVRLLPAGPSAMQISDAPSAGASLFSKAALPPAIALLGVVGFSAGMLGFWFFSERIGVDRGVPTSLIGVSIGLSSIATVVSAGVVAWLGARLSSAAYVVSGSAIVVGAMLLLNQPGDLVFVAAIQIYSIGYGVSYPGFLAIVRRVDATGRIFIASPAVVGVAGVLIALGSGPIIARGGLPGLVGVCILLVVVGAVFVLSAGRLLPRSLPPVAGPVGRPVQQPISE